MRRVVIDNRYKILKKIGAGAMGEVYKVRELKEKKIIALKILKKKMASSEAVQRFKREFKLLTELHHPNLCAVYDFGVLKDGRSYFTMEYIDGPNIFEFTKNPVRKNISNGVYPLIVQLCRVLEYIHSKGLIHYDIKPRNVLIQIPSESYENSVVKLMDFGLVGEQRVKGGTIIKGTFPYIAPEVIKGLEVDHRADLYSLGVLLYEIFTKRSLRVQGKESFASIIEQRRKWFLELPSKIVTDMPEKLERMIVRLCSLQPAARFSRANEVIREINKIAGLKFELETEKTLEGYILSSRFVGRDKEMGLLKSLYGQTRQGDGKVVLITGDAGIGKSRLLREFKTFTQMERSHTFIGHAYKDKIGPLEPFYDIFSELINYINDWSNLFRSRELKLSLAVLFKIFPGLTDGHLKKNLPKLVPLDPKQEKLRTFDAMSELIGYCASNLGELVILLEDLHWADHLSIQFLEYLGRNLSGRNIFICGTSRKEELKENLVFRKIITNLKNEDYFTQVELRPLKFRSLYSLLDSTITPGSNSSALVRYLMKKTGGNPFFVEEIMRTLLQKKGMSIGGRMDMAHLQKISIPKTIEDVVLKRLKDLDATSLEVVKFGAILLRGFTHDLMRRLTGSDDTELSHSLWELKRKQILVEEDNKYRFYHATLREAISKRMAYREKQKLYYQTGRILELIYKRNIEKVVEDLAYYFINARDRKKGVTYGLRATHKSSERYANEQAIKFYRGVLGLLGDKEPKRRFDILQKLAQIETFMGYYDDALKHYNKALKLRKATFNETMNVFLDMAKIHERKGEHKQELRTYRRAIRFLKKVKPSTLTLLFEIYTYLKMCWTYHLLGNYKRVSRFDFNSLKFPKEEPKSKNMIHLQGKIYNAMGNIESHRSAYGRADYNMATSYYKKALKYYKKINNEHEIGIVFHNLGICYNYKLDFKNALDCSKKAIQQFEKIGEPVSTSVSLQALGALFVNNGYYLKAIDCFKKALSISKRLGDFVTRGSSFFGIGLSLEALCDYTKAKEYLEKALNIFNTIGWKERQTYPLGSIGEVYQAVGDYNLALRFYRKSLKISNDIDNQHSIAGDLTHISSVFIEIGKFSKAKKLIGDALEIQKAIMEKELESKCYLQMCRINIGRKNIAVAREYCNKGTRIVEDIGHKKRNLVECLLLGSELDCYEKKYRKGIKVANKAIKMAREMGTKYLYAKALLSKAKHEIRRGIISKIDIIKLLDEAKEIAEEIGCPEVLWKIYYEYGRFLQKNREYRKALTYYGQCVGVFRNVVSKLKNASYKKSYLNRPDRQAAIQQPSLLLPEFENYLKRA